MPKRKIALLLAAACLAASLAACGEKPAPATSADTTVTTEATTEAPEFTPVDADYSGEFTMLLSGNCDATVAFKTFEDTDMTERTPLDEAVYRRMKTVEELYGIKFRFIEDYGTNGSAKTKLLVAATAGDDDYDAAVVAAYDAVPLAMGGALYELGSIGNLKLEKDRWDARAARDLTMHGLLFATTGDIDFWDDMMQNVIAFNKQVKADLNIEEDFYALVEDGKWTLDALASYAKCATEDLNSDGVYDMSDKFGLITWDDSVYAVLEGSGERVVTVGADGALALTLTGSEHVVDVLTKYTDFCFGGDAINYQRYTSKEAMDMFSGNRALFLAGRLQSLDAYRDMETDYGILPYPKYDEAQAEYHTVASPWHMTLFTVPLTAANAERSGAVLDALAYYGKELLTGAYYDKTLTGQYFRDEDSLATLERMAATRAYDLGLYIQPANINKQLIYMFREGSKDFASTFAGYADAANAALAQTDAAFSLAAETWKH